ncbi:proline-rich protein 3 isoform X2 [Ochotona princeps]|uniref:proline-rich protein 3 isoform X2 n=1 Tax=Ochotona princeps TaxID=9978 RepID=UPI002714A688|nr:proline-rich protein 3 isoform X2 [Ochotona princeps]XP_058522243.1 proline-rich protein 3 isoform X2 [Ochotona princeps]
MSIISRMDKSVVVYVCNGILHCNENEPTATGNLDESHKYDVGERSQTQKNADSLHRGPPGSRGPMIPPLLSLPPPPRGRGPMRGGLGPRCGPYGRGWWGVNAEPPFPGPGLGGPSRESFHKEQRNPRRLKSWSLIKNTCPPKDGPQVLEDKSDRPVCRHFSKKGHCRYEDLCAFYHPGVNGPPL